jgi:hypothetical protein
MGSRLRSWRSSSSSGLSGAEDVPPDGAERPSPSSQWLQLATPPGVPHDLSAIPSEGSRWTSREKPLVRVVENDERETRR